MFFSKLLKNFLIALGLLLIGFGIGMILAENFQIEERVYWLIIIGALILGGFLTALGIAKKIPEKKEVSKKEFKPPESEEIISKESEISEKRESDLL